MDATVFDAVRFLVNQARLKGTGSLAALRSDAIAAGFVSDDVESAIAVWAGYERGKCAPPVND
ncbi:hypothetical protein BLA39750_01154 [Burkholderia lata]|uniref:Uncharacterized protein n=1 Tax=Burkholderia lata (strain ATCC 17760 / DSM 23089 / LMG 22485 / NCIMB 9086 / R18194 / 383) TaxID=482957 RepID=A0A6P2VCY2_BURL3|nr:hypothetical protein [Burkholderia lata]VWC80401.1 hypothetical protein BLA39750_01154 [Burkholderia lata]